MIFRALNVVTQCLRRVSTCTGLKVTYAILNKMYQLKRQASDRFLKSFPIRPAKCLPDWNYTVVPANY